MVMINDKFYGSVKGTWNESHALCAAMGASLATIDTEADRNAVLVYTGQYGLR